MRPLETSLVQNPNLHLSLNPNRNAIKIKRKIKIKIKKNIRGDHSARCHRFLGHRVSQFGPLCGDALLLSFPGAARPNLKAAVTQLLDLPGPPDAFAFAEA